MTLILLAVLALAAEPTDPIHGEALRQEWQPRIDALFPDFSWRRYTVYEQLRGGPLFKGTFWRLAEDSRQKTWTCGEVEEAGYRAEELDAVEAWRQGRTSRPPAALVFEAPAVRVELEHLAWTGYGAAVDLVVYQLPASVDVEAMLRDGQAQGCLTSKASLLLVQAGPHLIELHSPCLEHRRFEAHTVALLQAIPQWDPASACASRYGRLADISWFAEA